MLRLNIRHIPSGLKGFRQCGRRWRFQQDAPPQENAAFAFGTAMHAQRERYFKEGVEPQHPCARAGLDDLPAGGSATPDGPIFCERTLVQQVGLVELYGQIDLIDLSIPNLPRVIDHKTSSSIDRFALKPHEIATDPQLNAYAYLVLTQLAPTAETILLQHHYMQKDPVDSTVREAEVSRHQIEAAWRGLEHSVAEMVYSLMLDPMEVAANMSHCSDYGGCPFREPCLDGGAPF